MTVEDGVFIGPGAILTNDRYPRAITADGEPRPCRPTGPSARSTSATALDRRGRDRRRRDRRRLVRDGRRGGRGDPSRRRLRARGRQSGAPRSAGSAPAAAAADSTGGKRRRAGSRSDDRTLCPPVNARYVYVSDPEALVEQAGAARGTIKQGAPHDPDRPPRHRRRRGAAVAEVLDQRHAVQGRRSRSSRSAGPSTCGVKHAIAVSNGTVALMCIYAGLGPRARRRGHHGLAHVQRDRQLDPVHGRDAGLRRHRARHVPHRRRPGSRRRSRRGPGPSCRSTCSA